jgi:hypothetical protein
LCIGGFDFLDHGGFAHNDGFWQPKKLADLRTRWQA